MRRFTALACALLCAVTVQAKITLPSLLGDGMVLQRNTTVQLWGHATGTSVKVVTSWDKCKYQVRPDASGNWCVQVTTPDAGGPYEISFNDGTELKLRDILIGEVWICSGQSNMEMPLGGWDHQPVDGAYETIRDAASTPLLRMFTVARNNADTPQEDCRGEWKSSTPGALRSFSATAYHFGKTLSSFMPGLPPPRLFPGRPCPTHPRSPVRSRPRMDPQKPDYPLYPAVQTPRPSVPPCTPRLPWSSARRYRTPEPP